MFVQIDRRTLILKMIKIDVFLIKPNHKYQLSQGDNVFMVPNLEKNRDYYVNPCLYKLRDEHPL